MDSLILGIAACIGLACVVFAFAWQFSLRLKAESALKDAREQIQSRERKIQTILNNAPIVFSAIDRNGIFQISEGKGLEKLGRKSNQSIGLSIYEMHSQNPVILDAVAKALGGEQVATSFVLNGVSYDLFIGPEKNSSGVVTGASMLSVDISDRKKIEEEKAQLLIREKTAVETTKLKSEFLATMSHEIRTPINGVLGMTALLMDTPLTPEQREFAEAITQSGSGLLTVINDILDFSKIEAGKLDFEEIHFNLPDLIRHAMKSLKYSASHKVISVVTEIGISPHIWVKGDPGRFRQILNNLVGNAIKFTEKGQVTVRVASLPVSSESSRHAIRVEIEDTGIGISSDALNRMFVAFSQAEASMSRRFGGTGLGLSISKQLVEKMGGQIGAISEKGKGSTFWFTVFFDAGEMQVEKPGAGDFTSSLFSSSGHALPKILVAEDNQVNQVITARLLKKMGLESEVVSDGIEALEALKRSDYDLVLMDCQMPGLDGLEATRRIRAGDCGRNQSVPILAMTANAMSGDREMCLAAGMDDYVSKPIAYPALSAAVLRWLEVRRQRMMAKAG